MRREGAGNTRRTLKPPRSLISGLMICRVLARIFHQPSTATALCRTLHDFSSVRALNIVSTMPAHSSVAKVMQRSDVSGTAFRRLATYADEKRGLASVFDDWYLWVSDMMCYGFSGNHGIRSEDCKKIRRLARRLLIFRCSRQTDMQENIGDQRR
jgi:hypothetical protein